MAHPHWQYFLALEADLEATTRFVEPAEANYGTYSIEFAKILLAAGSEVDVVAKILSGREQSSNVKINDHRQAIVTKYPRFTSLEITIPRYQLHLTPWSDWSGDSNPDWWKAYNEVKHARGAKFPAANLENTLNGVTGLLCLNLYLHEADYHEGRLAPWPRLLDYENYFATGAIVARPPRLPDFEARGS